MAVLTINETKQANKRGLIQLVHFQLLDARANAKHASAFGSGKEREVKLAGLFVDVQRQRRGLCSPEGIDGKANEEIHPAKIADSCERNKNPAVGSR
jgi:hypothetical protein